MSDFNANFWSVYVAGLTAGRHPGLPAAAVDHGPQEGRAAGRQHHRPRLGRRPARDEQPDAALVDVAVRDHHRLRRCCTWSPIRAWAAIPGQLNWTTRGQYDQEVEQANEELGPLYAQFAAKKTEELAGDGNAMAIGERLFMNNCAQCHGSDARGSKGFPNLTDKDWLHGGTPEKIEETIKGGRRGQMPPMAAAVGTPDDVKNVANYVLSLSNSPHDSVRAQLGKAKFTACAACHGIDGKGNQAIGAPNLTDDIWLHGWGEQAVIAMVNNGKINEMPAQARQADRRPDPRAGRLRLGPVQQARRRPNHEDSLVQSPAVRKVIPIAPDASQPAEGAGSLYEAQKKIYPREAKGVFARWRWIFVFLTQLVFYGLPWLEWGQRQAVLFDLGARRFYLFGYVLYPQDFIYLTALLVISALSLFLFTAVAGRLWCGFSCPQTVYTEIFMWIERKVEGDRVARMRLDAAPMSLAEAGPQVAEALHLAGPGALDRLHVRGLFLVGARTGRRPAGRQHEFVGSVLGPVLRPGDLRQRRLPARAGVQVHVPLRALPERHVRPRHADRELRRGARRAARLAFAQGRSGRAVAGLVRRLQPVRACLSHRHRHPPGPAIRVHRLRGLRGRVRRRDGEDELSEGTDPLHHAERDGPGLDPARNVAARAAAARAGLRRPCWPPCAPCWWPAWWCARR